VRIGVLRWLKGLEIKGGLVVAIFIESVFASFIKLMLIPIFVHLPFKYFNLCLMKPLKVLP
jgi:hypothetical protein